MIIWKDCQSYRLRAVSPVSSTKAHSKEDLFDAKRIIFKIKIDRGGSS